MTARHPVTFADVLSREQAAEAAIYLGDPEPFKALWSRGDDISLFGAFGPCKKGWHQVEKTVEWVASHDHGQGDPARQGRLTERRTSARRRV